MTLVGTPVLVRRSLRAAQAVERGLDQGLGEAWRDTRPEGKRSTGMPWAKILFAPVPLLHLGVQRLSNISYGDAGRRNRLDLYRRRNGGATGPVLIHLPARGSTFAPGRKSFYARRLLFRLARQGWVCISATYSLRPEATFPASLIDIKKLIAWTRAHAIEHGGDPDRIILAGSRSGAHLATTAGFTRNDPVLQPRFEGADTSVKAIVGLYGYYGPIDSRSPAAAVSPFDYVERIPAAAHRPRRPRHLHIGDSRALSRRGGAEQIRQPSRLRRTRWRTTLVRLADLNPFRGRNRRHRGFCGIGRCSPACVVMPTLPRPRRSGDVLALGGWFD